MKIRLCITLGWIFFLSSLNQVQCQSFEEDQFYAELKKIVSKTAMLNPFDSTGRKYISFSYEVRIGNEASVKISEHAPRGSKNRIEKLKDDLVNYIESLGKEFDNELIIIYPVLFNFDYLKGFEMSNPDLKILLDKLRVYTLIRYRIQNAYPDYVKKEISKVDFKNIEIYYKLHYKLPYWIVNFYYKLRSIISQVLKK